MVLIQGTFDVLGGYSIDGREYRSEEAEALVDEAKTLAVALAMHNVGSARKSVEDVLAGIVPAEQLEAP